MRIEEFIESIRFIGEEWADIPGFNGYYKVSSMGRVLSTAKREEPHLMHPTTLQVRGCRYYTVSLYGDEKPKRKTIHRLVASAFLPNPQGFPEVDHINRNGQDNRVENLRWCDRKMNMANALTKEVLLSCHDNHDGSYRWRPVVRISPTGDIKHYESITSTQRDGFKPLNVCHVCRGEKHTHLGYKWMYLSDYEKIKGA